MRHGFRDFINNIFFDEVYTIPAVPYQFSFQEPATPVMSGLLDLHDYVFFFIIVILSVVLLLLFCVVFTFSTRNIESAIKSASFTVFFKLLPHFVMMFFLTLVNVFRMRDFVFVKKALLRRHHMRSEMKSNLTSLNSSFLKNVSLDKFNFSLLDGTCEKEDSISSMAKAAPVLFERDIKKASRNQVLKAVKLQTSRLANFNSKLSSSFIMPIIKKNIFGFLLSNLEPIQKESKIGFFFFHFRKKSPFVLKSFLNTLNNSIMLGKSFSYENDNIIEMYEDDYHRLFSFFEGSSITSINNLARINDGTVFIYSDFTRGSDRLVGQFDQDKEGYIDIIFSNIIYNLMTSKISQRYNYLRKSCIFIINKGLSDLADHFDVKYKAANVEENPSLFSSAAGDTEKNEEDFVKNPDQLINYYLTTFFSSCLVRLHQNLRIGYFNHSTRLEIIWTLIPIAIIALIITPSFFFMYAIDEDMESLLTVRVIGHQWFWSYIYSFPNFGFGTTNQFFTDSKNLAPLFGATNYSFDSYMLDDISKGAPRLLSTDSVLILPKYSHINCVITSSDVLHSWALPSLGVKVDAVPGRLNRVDLFIEHQGMFFGQCSELCGVNHAFMPIQIQAVSISNFLEYISKIK